mmetsp:Transcript_127990/g.370389  ORF Transcript_127990/g.370389 Transcript_127990/m.370389 type:complete len:444 (+) Transcript_127990:766-2097(+)
MLLQLFLECIELLLEHCEGRAIVVLSVFEPTARLLEEGLCGVGLQERTVRARQPRPRLVDEALKLVALVQSFHLLAVRLRHPFLKLAAARQRGVVEARFLGTEVPLRRKRSPPSRKVRGAARHCGRAIEAEAKPLRERLPAVLGLSLGRLELREQLREQRLHPRNPHAAADELGRVHVLGCDAGLAEGLLDQLGELLQLRLHDVLKLRTRHIDLQVALVGVEALQRDGGVRKHRQLLDCLLQRRHQSDPSLGCHRNRLVALRLQVLVDVLRQRGAEALHAELWRRNARQCLNGQLRRLGALLRTEGGKAHSALRIAYVNEGDDAACLPVAELLRPALRIGSGERGGVGDHVHPLWLPAEDVRGGAQAAQLRLAPSVGHAGCHLEWLQGVRGSREAVHRLSDREAHKLLHHRSKTGRRLHAQVVPAAERHGAYLPVIGEVPQAA